MTQPQVAAVLVFSALGMWVWHLAANRTRFGRYAARTAYRNDIVPFAFRILPFAAHIVFAPMLLALGVIALFLERAEPGLLNPPWIPVAVCFLWFGGTLLWVHLDPRRFLPGWLRQDIESGAVTEASPDVLDWAYAALPIVLGALFFVLSLLLVLRGG